MAFKIKRRGKQMKIAVCKECGSVLNPSHKTKAGKWRCVKCVGLDEEEALTEVQEVNPVEATCSECGKTPSQTSYNPACLPYYNPVENTFYCGCGGW
jgi:hypothetical protein